MASGTIKAVASKADIVNKADSIYLTSSDTTWSDVWAKLSTLKTGYAAPLFSVADASKVLTNNVRPNTLAGMIVKSSSARFYLLYHHSTANNGFAVATLDANSAGVTNYAERDIVGMFSEFPIYRRLTITDGASVTIANSSHIEMDLMASASARCGALQISSSAAGTIYHNQVGASGVTITKATNKITFAVSGTTYAWCTIYQGDITLDS